MMNLSIVVISTLEGQEYSVRFIRALVIIYIKSDQRHEFTLTLLQM